MKQVVFISALFSLILLSGCQTQKDPARILAEQEEIRLLHKTTVEAIKDREFVLEADRLVFKYGHTAHVSSSTNFIAVSGQEATIQITSNFSPYAGPNGIGGVTVTGRISNIKESVDKNGTLSFSMNVVGIGVSATVSFNLPKGTNQCTVIVSPNLNSNVITFIGSIYPTEFSEIYKGRPL